MLNSNKENKLLRSRFVNMENRRSKVHLFFIACALNKCVRPLTMQIDLEERIVFNEKIVFFVSFNEEQSS